MSIAKKPTRKRSLPSAETLEASRRDRAGRKITPVPARIPAHILEGVRDKIEASLATVPRNTYFISAIEKKVTHDEKSAKVSVPPEYPTDNEVMFTLRIPTVLANRLEAVLKHLTYQASGVSRNRYIIGAAEESLRD